ncbi:MAG: HIT family protein [Planctomycetota bacterium]|jgi:histidine triad (HIT) family protein
MSRDPDCIFCKVVAGEIPASVIFENESVVAFLDIGPLAEGHVLIIPRAHHAKLSDLSAPECAQLGSVLPKVARALLEVTGADGFNLLVNEGRAAGQLVPHVHIHLIPRVAKDRLGYRWNAGTYPAGRADELATAYQAALALHDE